MEPRTITDVADIDPFALEAGAREETYRKIRDLMERYYSQRVGPRSTRQRRERIAKRRESGSDGQARSAGREERTLEGEQDAYDRASHVKHVLAILTGRYDHALDSPGSQGHAEHRRDIDRAATMRREEALV